MHLKTIHARRAPDVAESGEAIAPVAVVKESQEPLQSIVDNSPAVIYVKYLGGRYLLINRRFEEIFHLSRDAVLGRTDHDFFPKDAADAFRSMDLAVAAAGRTLTQEEVAPHVSGPHTYLSVKTPLRDSHGAPYAILGISTDISDRKRAEQRLRDQLDRLSLLATSTRQFDDRRSVAPNVL